MMPDLSECRIQMLAVGPKFARRSLLSEPGRAKPSFLLGKPTFGKSALGIMGKQGNLGILEKL